MPDRGGNREWLRSFALALERLAAEGIAGGAVRGAADELRAGLRDGLDDHGRALLAEGLSVVERFVRETSTSPTPAVETWTEAAARGATRGLIEEFRRLIPEMRPMTQELFTQVRHWLDGTAAEAAAHASEVYTLSDRARVAAAGAIAGAAEQLHAVLPALAGPAGEFAAKVGGGFVRGAADETRRRVKLAGRDPRLRLAALGGAFVAVLLVLRRR